MRTLLLERYASLGIFQSNDPHLESTSILCNDLFSHYSDLDEKTRKDLRAIPPFDKTMLQFSVNFEDGTFTETCMFFFCRKVADPLSEVQWLMDIECWGPPNTHQANKEPLVAWRINLDKQGRLAGENFEVWLSKAGKVFMALSNMEGEKTDPSDLNIMLNCCLFALNLMNCKNVVLEEAPLSHRQKRNIRMGKPNYRYHVLKIRRGKKLYDFDQETSGSGGKNSIHMCRGHFKTYTEDAPLMGKFVGTYYWGAFMRGRDKDKFVDKDYELLESEAS